MMGRWAALGLCVPFMLMHALTLDPPPHNPQMAIRLAREHSQRVAFALAQQGRLDLVKCHDFMYVGVGAGVGMR